MTRREREELRRQFARGFGGSCGVEVESIRRGRVRSRLTVRPEHRSPDGDVVHDGVIATIAVHTARSAGSTTTPSGRRLATVALTISYLRPAIGHVLTCRADVIKRGGSIIVVQSPVYSRAGPDETLVAVAMMTLLDSPTARPPRSRE